MDVVDSGMHKVQESGDYLVEGTEATLVVSELGME